MERTADICGGKLSSVLEFPAGGMLLSSERKIGPLDASGRCSEPMRFLWKSSCRCKRGLKWIRLEQQLFSWQLWATVAQFIAICSQLSSARPWNYQF